MCIRDSFATAMVVMSMREYVEFRIGNTTICVPKEYVPGLSSFGEWLSENVSGLDDSGQQTIIRLPPEYIRSGVGEYKLSHRRYSDLRKVHFNYRHVISGIAWNIKNVGNPYALDGECSYADRCKYTVVYKDIVYIYNIHQTENSLSKPIREFITTSFENWENGCV